MKVPPPPQRGDYFVSISKFAIEDLKVKPGKAIDELYNQESLARQRPWVEKDYPRIAAWLRANEKPLAVVIEATKRRNYYNPLVSLKSGEEGSYALMGALLPNLQPYREISTALVARAMLHAGAGKFDEAWQDLLACQRLSRLLMRGATLSEYLIGVAINSVASSAEQALLERANPTAKQAQAWLRDLQRLPPGLGVADIVDLTERCTYLQTMLQLRRSPHKILKVLEGMDYELLGQQPKSSDKEVPRAVLESLDWDSILRSGNGWCDRMVAAHRIKDHTTREKEFEQIDKELRALRKKVGIRAELSEALSSAAPAKAMSKKLGDSIIGLLLPALPRIQRWVDRNEQVQRNLYLAFALAAYRADHGRYPERLEALAPAYLEQVPDDLFSGKALIYRPAEKGYLLYSVGVNGRDDGGRSSLDNPPGDDLAIRMPLPEVKQK
jgi:hypothetical protein